MPSDPTTPPVTCPTCGSEMQPGGGSNLFQCPECRTILHTGRTTPSEPPPAPRRDGDAMPVVDEAVAAILTVRDYLDAGPVKATKDQAMRAFIGIVATWKRDRDELAALAKRRERAEAERWVPVAERLPPEDEQVLCYSPMIYVREGSTPNVFRVTSLFASFAKDWNITHWQPLPQPPAESAAQEGTVKP